MESLLQDVRYGWRGLRKTPGVTVVAVMTLALGVGANTAIFSLADAFLWRQLPVPHPEELVFVRAALPSGGTTGSFAYSTFEQLRDSNRTLSGLFAYDDSSVSATVLGQPEYLSADFVSGSYFDVLGVTAVRGRTFTADDDQPGKPAVAVISDRYWERRFGRDPSVVGKTIDLGTIPFTVIGITPPRFFGRKVAGKYADLVLPMFMQPRLALRDHDTFGIMARLKPGTSREQARADLDVIHRRVLQQAVGAPISAEAEREILARSIQLTPGLRGSSSLDNDLATQLPILLAVVGVVLLIACVNVANLLLSRAATRQKEIAVRLSVGASRARLIRQLLTESLLLALLGGALGLLLAYWGVGLFVRILSYGQTIVFDLRPDVRTLAFTGGVSLLTGILFGLAPAMSATRTDLTPMFRGNVVGAESRPLRRHLAKAFVVSQVALSLALLVGAGLLVRTLGQAYAVDPGYEREKVMVMWVLPALNGYDHSREMALYPELLDKLNAIPGVASASLSRYRLVLGRPYRNVWVPHPGRAPEEKRGVYCGVVGPRFFRTMGIAVLKGREFSPGDGAAAPKVAVLSESMARTFLPENPIGRQIGFDGSRAPDIEIVGIVRDIRHRLLEQEPREAVYVPYAQASPGDLGQVNFMVRTAGDPTSAMPAIRKAVQSVDPNLPLTGVETQAMEVDTYLGGRRSLATLLTSFGALALVLAAIGLYGTMSHAVGRRTREFGIRMALGAQRKDMLWMVLREALSQVVIGVALGAAIALGASRLIAGVLFGVEATDPLTLAASVAVMSITAVAASYLPARRATRVDPMVSLRYE